MKKIISLLLAASMITVLSACGSSTVSSSSSSSGTSSELNNSSSTAQQPSGTDIPKPSKPKKYSMGSGSVGGNFYLMGGGISTLINNKLPDYFMFTTETTGGSTANLVMLQNGDAELGIAMASTLLDAINGDAEWTGNKVHDKIRGMVALYPSNMTIYTLKDSGINSLSDLNGKVVGLGSKGASMDTSLRKIFDELGIKPKSIHNDAHGATAKAVGDGVIDAAILFSYPPFPSIAELEGTKQLTFIPLTEEEQNKMLELYPFYSKGSMAAGSYKGITAPTPTVEEWNMVVTSSDVPADDVYLMTKALFENQQDMITVHSSAEHMIVENNLKFNIPLHEGTIRYMKEAGITVPDELIPPECK